MKKVSLHKAVAFGVLATVVCSAATGGMVYQISRPNGALTQAYSLLNEAQNLVDSKFVGEYEQSDINDGIMAGFVSGLGDRWTYYLSPSAYVNYLDSNAEDTVGIGVTVRSEQDNTDATVLTITSIAVSSPAEAAGFGIYDQITAVNGTTIDDLGGYQAAVDAILGEEGKTVTLTVRRYQTEEMTDITVTRQQYAQIHVTSRMLDDSIGYIAIERFTSETDEQFQAEVEKMQNAGAKSLIFDLRDNPGGQLGALVHSLDLLLPEGRIISLKDKDGKEEIFDSDAEEVTLPMAVIINTESYSAAEFFAAALQSYDKAVVVGEQTAGKGYSQMSYPLSNGGALNLSTNCYYMPNGESLIGSGVIPDVECTLSEEKTTYRLALSDEDDEQLQAAISALKS